MNESSIIKEKINFDINILVRQIIKTLYLIIKRIFDICISSMGLLISLPIFILVIILIKKEDHGQAIFSQERIGKNGQTFKLYKFRSMIINADDVLKEMLKDPKLKEEYKKNMKFENDPRITKIGKFIRKTSIDELPQLINVLKGNMSLIGNRPYLPREIEDMGIFYEDIIKTKPGITGYWQVSGRSNVTFKERCQMESYYSTNFSLLLDIKIFFLTIYVVLFRKGAE